ncbi:presenilins-associated rhomboid-like protein, mitochondrial [Alosa sapidissima]|uniref:presenilins-associated rhomboid-like protein, mitochondrial n=1 Tax=Alosa sapidissima TaxID=34773 RepID=UPI001C096D6D|nr:presenilins-associated rhomboid-like protein, mitochondrial [Alosa sapidissima]
MACWGYLNKWTKVQFITHTSVLSPSKRIILHPQQRCAFRKAQKKPETRKGSHEEPGRPPGDVAEAGLPRKDAPGPPHPPGMPPRNPRRLIKPLMFTVGFTGCSFGAAAILQYESVKSRLDSLLEERESEKTDKFQTHDTAHWHNWWNQLSDFQRQVILFMSVMDDMWSSLSEGQKVATGIIAINAAVLCCWRMPSLQRSMLKYFTTNPASKTRCLPMVLSSFSHYSIVHMVVNMYVLWTFSTSIVSVLGREQFLAFYTSAGVISTMVSYVCKTATGRLHPSLGASGAVMTVLAAVCTKMPEAKLAIVLLPMFSLTAGNALKALVAIDTTGLFLRWRIFDHAAHLGGTLFGVWYIAYGQELIWKSREPLVKFWHELRRGMSDGGRGPPRDGRRGGGGKGGGQS